MSGYQTERGGKQSAVLEQRGTFKKLYFNPKLHEGNCKVRVLFHFNFILVRITGSIYACYFPES